MTRRLIILLGIALLVCSCSLDTTGTPPHVQEKIRMGFPEIAHMYGFVCTKVSTISYKGFTERGRLTRINCDDDRLSYRVLMTPQDVLIVHPWSE